MAVATAIAEAEVTEVAEVAEAAKVAEIRGIARLPPRSVSTANP